jgi:hypothetical protein
MSEPLSDDELMARLSEIASIADPVPEALLSAARAAFALRDLDARVAELIRDSAIDASATAVRGPGPRMLSFESGEMAIECEVTPDAARRDIFGQLVGGRAPTVDAQVPGQQPVTVPVDADGCFSVRGLPPGPARLRAHLADGTTLVTSWTVI